MFCSLLRFHEFIRGTNTPAGGKVMLPPSRSDCRSNESKAPVRQSNEDHDPLARKADDEMRIRRRWRIPKFKLPRRSAIHRRHFSLQARKGARRRQTQQLWLQSPREKIATTAFATPRELPPGQFKTQSASHTLDTPATIGGLRATNQTATGSHTADVTRSRCQPSAGARMEGGCSSLVAVASIGGAIPCHK